MTNKIIEELKYWREQSNNNSRNSKGKEEYYKKCYELCTILEWQKSALENIEEQTGIKGRTIACYAKLYALNYLQMSEQEFRDIIYKYVYEKRNNSRNVKYLDAKFEFILKQLKKISINDKQAIIDLIGKYQEEFNFNPYYLREKIEMFVLIYYPEEGRTLLLSLDDKLNIYLEYLEEQKEQIRKEAKIKVQLANQPKKQQKLELITKYINQFLASDFYEVESFCQSRQLDINEFNELLIDCRRNNPTLYKIFLEKIMTQKNNYDLNAIQLANQLACVIKNGIKMPTGERRKFDIIDYHNMIGTDFKDTTIIIKDNISLENLRIIKNFFGSNNQTFTQNLLEIEKIRNGTTKIGFAIKDSENNQMIYYPTKEEIELVINYLEANNIPLNEFNYTIAIKRYLNNSLSLNNNNHIRRLQKESQ